MTVDSQMRRHGFAPWEAVNGVRGFQKNCRQSQTCLLVLLPVHGKRIQDAGDKVLACYFNDENQMCSDRFFDSLLDFLESNNLDTSRLYSLPKSKNRHTGIAGFLQQTFRKLGLQY